MAEGEKTRLVAWSREMREVHHRLRAALRATREALEDGGDAEPATRELLLFCRGFCTALTRHHRGEDRTLFPAVAAAHPELGDTLRRLEQDHSMIEYLLDGLRKAVDAAASPGELDRHLEGIAAIMENHFAYEERRLLTVLDALELDADPGEALGGL
ncbi:hemerythrin domain-containing protein [Streptomyces zhaozhouensis]|nr:hemerythrin domain-containing protein [Streptomyces zhaozhouensis]